MNQGRIFVAVDPAIAYDKSVLDLRWSRPLRVPTSFDFGDGCTSSNLRRPLAARMRAGELEFWIVGVHLKSRIGGTCSDRIRAQRQLCT